MIPRPTKGRSVLDRALAATAPLFRRRGALRVLAYHDVPEDNRFAAQLDHLAAHYDVVSAEVVLEALQGGPLPERAVWITFDDGDPSVIDRGLPELARRGMKATLFICPGVIDSEDGLWFQTARAHLPESEVSALKQLGPDERQAAVDALGPTSVRQCTRSELEAWVEAGNTLGNHTWSHPLLDQEPPDAVQTQIGRAADWLVEHFPEQPPLFAYPNGNWSPEADAAIRAQGYPLALLFDHRVARLDAPMKLSRIRVNAADPLPRFVASVSGAHPAFHKARATLQR